MYLSTTALTHGLLSLNYIQKNTPGIFFIRIFLYGDILHRDILGQGYFCVGYLLGYFRSGIFLLGIFMLGTAKMSCVLNLGRSKPRASFSSILYEVNFIFLKPKFTRKQLSTFFEFYTFLNFCSFTFSWWKKYDLCLTEKTKILLPKDFQQLITVKDYFLKFGAANI